MSGHDMYMDPWPQKEKSMGCLEDDLDAGVAEQARMLKRMREIANEEVMDELYSATRLFGGFASEHEGYAILLEEVEELWDEVKKKKPRNAKDVKKMRKEAIQVAAMAIRFIYDITEEKR